MQTISGDTKDVRSLWTVLGNEIDGLDGKELHLDAFMESKGAVVSTADLLTVAQVKADPIT